MQRGQGEAIQIRVGRIGDCIERKGRSYTYQVGTEVGRSATIQREKAEAIQIKEAQRGEDWRQYKGLRR